MRNVTIGRVNPEDDFETMLRLLIDTGTRRIRTLRYEDDVHVMPFSTVDSLRRRYFPASDEEERQTAFVAEAHEEIVGVMGVTVSQRSINAYTQVGFRDGWESILEELLNQCAQVVRANGGKALFASPGHTLDRFEVPTSPSGRGTASPQMTITPC